MKCNVAFSHHIAFPKLFFLFINVDEIMINAFSADRILIGTSYDKHVHRGHMALMLRVSKAPHIVAVAAVAVAVADIKKQHKVVRTQNTYCTM